MPRSSALKTCGAMLLFVRINAVNSELGSPGYGGGTWAIEVLALSGNMVLLDMWKLSPVHQGQGPLIHSIWILEAVASTGKTEKDEVHQTSMSSLDS